MKANQKAKTEYRVDNLVWDCVFIVVGVLCALALLLAMPTHAKAAERAESDAWRGALTLADVQVAASDAQARYAPNFGRNLTAGSVGNTLAQPQQPNTAGIHGAATQLRIGF